MTRSPFPHTRHLCQRHDRLTHARRRSPGAAATRPRPASTRATSVHTPVSPQRPPFTHLHSHLHSHLRPHAVASRARLLPCLVRHLGVLERSPGRRRAVETRARRAGRAGPEQLRSDPHSGRPADTTGHSPFLPLSKAQTCALHADEATPRGEGCGRPPGRPCPVLLRRAPFDDRAADTAGHTSVYQTHHTAPRL